MGGGREERWVVEVGVGWTEEEDHILLEGDEDATKELMKRKGIQGVKQRMAELNAM